MALARDYRRRRLTIKHTHPVTALEPTPRSPATILVGDSAAFLLQVDLQDYIQGLDGDWLCQSPNQGISKFDRGPDLLQAPSAFKPHFSRVLDLCVRYL